MKVINKLKRRTSSIALLAAVALAFSGSAANVFAHGGEDHGAAEPKTVTTDQGTISRTLRVGDLEVLLKHQPLTPDAAAAARLFITEFATNESFAAVVPAIEIEAANGAVTSAAVEKTASAGSFTVKFPPLAAGNYLIRAKLTHNGETDTATFSGVQIQNAPAATVGNSWTETALTAVLFFIAALLFGVLIYFAVRVFRNEPLREETVSA